MTSCQLTIQIDQAGLETLSAAGQRIALVKTALDSPYVVVWQAVTPLQDNIVTWDDSYGLYVSTTGIKAGAVLNVGSVTTDAAGGNTYIFAGGRFDSGTSNLALSDWGIRNNSDMTIGGVEMLTGGLSQVATVNGQQTTNPLDAQAIPFQERGITSATDRVVVFPASGIEPGTLLDRRRISASAAQHASIVVGTPLVVDLATVTAQTIHYDHTRNRFVLDQ